VPGTVNVRTEHDAFVGYFRYVAEAEHLIPAAVGQDRAVPRCEGMQPSGIADEIISGPQMQVIGVAEDDRRAALHQFLRRHRLHRGLRAHGHEDGRKDQAVAGLQSACPRGTEELVFSSRNSNGGMNG